MIMNRVFLVLVLSICTASVFAQGGSWYVGGEVGYNSTSSDATGDPSTTNWTLGPEVGTFFNEKWSAGLVLKFQGSSSKNDDGDISKSNSFSPDLYGRRWWKAGDRLNLFTGLDVAFGSGSTTTYGVEDVTVDNSNFGVNLNGGAAYAMADRWTLLLKLAGLGYSSNKVGDVTTTEFGLVADGNITSNQFVFIGVYYTFKQAK
jgi:opacity protein-like surface antigen